MKVAVVYNRESRNVINLFGMPNKETIGQKTIQRISNALKKGGHQVAAFEGDKDLVDRLEEFMPRVLKGERPGMVFNVSYGIQGQARYTHVPSILEMVGVPYVASGPLAHSLSLDKVVAKMILRQHGLPTPDFHVMQSPDAPPPALSYPMIVKPKNESVSFGIKVVHDERELRAAAAVIFEEYRQAVLVEQYIEGREINVGLIGNNPPEAFPPVELLFGEEGPRIYTMEDKKGQSGREIGHACPAPVGEDLLERARELSIRAFEALGCYDCARVDMRLDADGNLHILEINSLPSLGEHGSYLVGAAHVGQDFDAVVNRLVEAASARYFGTPEPPSLDRGSADPGTQVFSFITQRRDTVERRLREWIEVSSHTDDPVGLAEAVRRADKTMRDLRMIPAEELTDGRSVWTWQTQKGVEKGTLFVAHLDVPHSSGAASPRFRREPEWLFGDGIGSSRGGLVMLEYVLRAVRSARKLRTMPLGVLLYTDEGRDARYSSRLIEKASSRAARVIVLRPGGTDNSVVVQRRGQRKYRFRVEGEPRRPARASKSPEILRWTWNQLEALASLSSRTERISVSAMEVKTEAMPMLLPHRVSATLLVTYPSAKVAGTMEERMRAAVSGKGPRWDLELLADRPPMVTRRGNGGLARAFEEVARQWEIPLKTTSSVWPSVAGLVPEGKAALCGVGPVARDLGTPHESVHRIGLIQRTLLLAQVILSLDAPVK